MELRKLEYFESVARLSSFTKAADELHVSQPTISAAIKKLETDVGLPLFVRDKRNVILTYEGEIFLQKVKDVLSKLDQAIADTQELSEHYKLTLNIGIAPISGAFLYSILYNSTWKNNSKISYKILEFGTYGILDAIELDELDLGYVVLENRIKETHNYITSKEGEIQVLVNKGHPFTQYDRIPVRLLDNMNVIHYPTHSFIRRKMDIVCSDHNLNFNIIATPVQMITVYNLVQNGLGISFVLGNSYSDLTKEDALVAIPMDPPLYYKTGFVWKKDKSLSKTAKMIIERVNKIKQI